MTKEIFRIQSAANKNLLFGVGFCSAGAIVLVAITYTGFPSANQSSGVDIGFLLARVAPRMLTGILISSVGFFFLRLYMSNEMDIKHTKNEITNIESRMIALNAYGEFAWQENLSRTDAEVLTILVRSFVSAERNFAVGRGGSTVSHEGIDRLSDSLDVLTTIAEKFPWIAESKAPGPRSARAKKANSESTPSARGARAA